MLFKNEILEIKTLALILLIGGIFVSCMSGLLMWMLTVAISFPAIAIIPIMISGCVLSILISMLIYGYGHWLDNVKGTLYTVHKIIEID